MDLSFLTTILDKAKDYASLSDSMQAGLGSAVIGAIGGPENARRRKNLTKASYYRNPILTASLKQPYDYTDAYGSLMGGIMAGRGSDKSDFFTNANNWVSNERSSLSDGTMFDNNSFLDGIKSFPQQNNMNTFEGMKNSLANNFYDGDGGFYRRF